MYASNGKPCHGVPMGNGLCKKHGGRDLLRDFVNESVYGHFTTGPLRAARDSIRRMADDDHADALKDVKLGNEMELARLQLVTALDSANPDPYAVSKRLEDIRKISEAMIKLEAVRTDRSSLSATDIQTLVLELLQMCMAIFLAANSETDPAVRASAYRSMIAEVPGRLDLDGQLAPQLAPMAKLYTFIDKYPDEPIDVELKIDESNRKPKRTIKRKKK